MEPLILAIDLGTSGPKVALVSPRGQVLDSRVGAIGLSVLPRGGAEQDPAEWWTAITTGIRDLLAANPGAAARVTAIGCTSQWSGTVAVDEAGRPLMNAVIWMDARGAPYVRQITGGWPTVAGYNARRLLAWVRRTGGIPTHSGKDSIAHILFIRHERPDVYRATYKFLEPKDYLNLCFTGQFAASYDSITLHWVTDNRDIHNVRYDDGLLALATLDRAKLPDLKRATDMLGPIRPDVAAALGLSPDVAVIMGTPDLHSAAVGSGAVADFEPHLYIGTSSWLTCHVPYKKTDLFHNMASLPAALPGKYFLINEQETAGACLAFLRDNILYADDLLARETRVPNVYPLFDEMVAAAPPGSDRVIFTPWLNGERTPVDDELARGGFHNLSLRTTRAHMVRAVFEGVAYNTKWLLGAVERFVGRRLDNIRMIGGGAKSDVWCQIHADVLDRAIGQVAAPVEANVRGIGLLTALAMGYTTEADIDHDVPIVRTYEPDPANRRLYDELYAAYGAIYKQNKGIYHRLNRP